MKTLKDIDIKDKRVIIRCDFNVPIKEGKIIDDTRILGSLNTINYCLSQNAKIILLSHLGRIKEESDLIKNDLYPVAKRLSELLDKKESKNNQELGAYWASLGDIFINDAFGTAHREHASNVGIATHLPSAFGFLIEKELTALSLLDNPPHPFVVILGGAKVSDKIGVIENLANKADKIIIGGGMAFTFLKAQEINIGKSLLDKENIEFCKNILANYSEKIILPIDVAVTKEYTNDETYRVKAINEISDEEMGLDIGPKTKDLFCKELKDSQLVVWNGPLGVYEFSKYKKHTDEVLEYIVTNNIKTILGGGDTAAAAVTAGYKEKIYHISTGGGATLEYLEGKKLPGIEAIK